MLNLYGTMQFLKLRNHSSVFQHNSLHPAWAPAAPPMPVVLSSTNPAFKECLPGRIWVVLCYNQSGSWSMKV